ncbi:ATP-binding protein [Sediminicola sp. 1XM1-17]|uniref:ATP-binding protein n=1 Tax=Sediminicola sp. 1XM1-17 TaxID=3127702 RepID=UPI00307871D0
MNKSKNKFRLKIIFSYLFLGILALVSAFFIFSEIRTFVSYRTSNDNEDKLVKTGSLLTELYEAESLSKIALQKKTQGSFSAYTQKIDSIYSAIDSIKGLTKSEHQKGMLDSVQYLLQKKVGNSKALLKLKIKNEANSTIDNALKEFNKIEESMGRITPESLNPNYADLPENAKIALKKWADYLSENVPKDSTNIPDGKRVDSLLTASRTLLDEAKQNNTNNLRTVAQKEQELNRNDLEISQQLRGIIAAFEEEILTKSYNENLIKQAALTKSIRLAGFATLLGFAIVGLFTFLITKDYWRVQLFRQKLEKEKKYSESLLKSREQLISTVSHDLRTPLNTITGYSELMENEGLTRQQVSYLKNIRSASSYVDSLVNDLLDFSKLEAGKILVQNKAFILSELIKETAENLKELNSHKPIELLLSIDSRLEKPIMSDPFRIRQILTNLISNAFKFTDQGFVKIEASVVTEANGFFYTNIKIIDSGIGVKKDKQEHIFNEFTQAEVHTDKKYGGYGLGLTITKKLTELLHGKISIKSDGIKGSEFIIELPLQISNAPLKESAITTLKPQEGLRILIIDDDPAMLKLLSEVCRNLQISTRTFSDFKAIGKHSSLHYDLVLTDIQMPNITGFEVLKKLREGNYDHYRQQPIIAMTGRKDLEENDYLEAGFSAVLLKPFAKDSFLKVLAQLFPKKVEEQKKESRSKSIQPSSTIFSLEVINSFLGDNKTALHEVLNTFIADVNLNLQELKGAVDSSDQKGINATSHRMLPMFRQLKANDVVPILERLEVLKQDEMDPQELKKSYRDLKNKTTVLLLAITAYMAKDPIYND